VGIEASNNAPPQDRLQSWKEIAAYLNCSISTAQRREKDKGLPIRHHDGSVWAYKSELDAWFNSRDAAQPSPAVANADDAAARPSTAGWLRLGFIGRASPLGTAIVLGVAIPVLLTRTGAYGVATIVFDFSAALVSFLYIRGADTFLRRSAVALFISAAMSFSVSASTLGQLSGMVVNITTLRPAALYPFITGLRFVPCFVLLLLFWVVLKRYEDDGFATNQWLGKAYIGLGLAFLAATILSSTEAFGDYEIWRAGLPERGMLLAGYAAILIANVAAWFLGARSFRSSKISGYSPLFLQCIIVYLPLAVIATSIDAEYNWINKYHLDQRRPHAYIIRNPDAVNAFRLQPGSREIGPDLVSILNNPEFDEILRTKRFFKQDFDELFQVWDRAVMFGYKSDARPGEAAKFIIIRFPEELATALRFDLVGPEATALLN
jgi:predicted DNA-binding transcriptional regulator AlpA